MVKEAVAIDVMNWNTLWQNAITKEMEHLKVSFHVIQNSEKAPNGYQFVRYQMVFDIKMKLFYRKTYLVAGGNVIHTPDVITYSSVVIRETACITLTMAALHDLEIKQQIY